MQQNQPLRKLSIGEVFYARQVWLYNLTVVRQTDDNTQSKADVRTYTWLETEAGRGSNEVGSAVHHYLRKLESSLQGRTGLTLRLFSDAWSSQNKNAVMLCLLVRFVERSKVFDRVVHTFPVRGHSYMPPDRVFGRIEKDLRKVETTVSPAQYHRILEQHGTVLRWDIEWQSQDYQTIQKRICKTMRSFKMQEQKVFIYDKVHSGEVGVKAVYSQSEIFASFLKKGRKLSEMDAPVRIPKTNKVQVQKKNDVKKLMAFFETPDEAKDFYNDITSATATKGHDVEHDAYADKESFV